MAKKSTYGRETNDADITARQQSDLAKARKMMEEDSNPETRKKYTADQLGERLKFITNAHAEVRRQKEYDDEVADRPVREAANELKRETSRGGKPQEPKGIGPKLSFLTPERLSKSRVAMGGSGDYKKGGKVKKYATGGLTPAERKAMLDEKVAPPRGTTKKEADIFKPGMKPPVDDDMGSAKPVKKAKGGMARSASSRADGCAIRGKTRA
jgi:hypothetical protein